MDAAEKSAVVVGALDRDAAEIASAPATVAAVDAAKKP